MNVGYDGRLYPSNSSAQAGNPPKINERLGIDIRNASPEAQKLVGLIGEAGAMIYKTGERIRNEDFAIDSQKMRLDYAQGMENARREMEGRQYSDLNAWQKDFAALEKANRERVLNSARGTGGKAGYFRNWNSWSKQVSSDLEILGGRAQLNALQQWNQKQVRDHYAAIDQSYKDAVFLGTDGLDMLKATIDGDDRIPADAKASVYGEKSSLAMAMTARNRANATIQSVMSPEQRSAYLDYSASDPDFSNNLASWHGAADTRFKDAEEYGVSLIEAGREAALKGVSDEKQMEVIKSRYKKEIYSFRAAMNTSRKQLREWFSGIKKEASAKDMEEFRNWKDTGGLLPLNRPGALRFKEAMEFKSSASSAKKGDLKTSVIGAMREKATNTEGLSSDQARLVRALSLVGTDKEDGTIVFDEVSSGISFGAEEQRAMIVTAFTEDLVLAAQQSRYDVMAEILENANRVFDKSDFDELSEVAGKLASKEGSSVHKGLSEERAKIIQARLFQEAGVKNGEELLMKYPELASLWAVRKANILSAQTPESLQSLEIATNAAIDAAIKKERGKEFIKNSLAISTRIVSMNARRVKTPSAIAPGAAPRRDVETKYSGESKHYSAKTASEEVKMLDSKVEEGADSVELASLSLGDSEEEAKRKRNSYIIGFWKNEAKRLGANMYGFPSRPSASMIRDRVVAAIPEALRREESREKARIASEEKKKQEDNRRSELEKKLKELGLPLERRAYNSFLGIGGFPVNSDDEIELGVYREKRAIKEEGTYIYDPLGISEMEEIIRQYEEIKKRTGAKDASRKKRIEELRNKLGK